MKYTELDGFNNNEFKLGDMVRAYGCAWAGSLASLGSNTVNQDIIQEIDGEIIRVNAHWYHFKQCRKLVEEKPREWHIHTATKGITYDPVRGHELCFFYTYKDESYPKKVCEVLDENN